MALKTFDLVWLSSKLIRFTVRMSIAPRVIAWPATQNLHEQALEADNLALQWWLERRYYRDRPLGALPDTPKEFQSSSLELKVEICHVDT